MDCIVRGLQRVNGVTFTFTFKLKRMLLSRTSRTCVNLHLSQLDLIKENKLLPWLYPYAHKIFQNCFLFYHLKVKVKSQSCPTLCDPVDCSPPGSSVHGILQARVLEWVAISFSRGSSRPRDQTQVSRIAGRRFNLWATKEALFYHLELYCYYYFGLFYIL